MRIRLLKEEGLMFRGDYRGECIRCDEGIVWLTQEGDLTDHFLFPGEEFIVSCAGTIIMEARRNSLLSLQSRSAFTLPRIISLAAGGTRKISGAEERSQTGRLPRFISSFL